MSSDVVKTVEGWEIWWFADPSDRLLLAEKWDGEQVLGADLDDTGVCISLVVDGVARNSCGVDLPLPVLRAMLRIWDEEHGQ